MYYITYSTKKSLYTCNLFTYTVLIKNNKIMCSLVNTFVTCNAIQTANTHQESNFCIIRFVSFNNLLKDYQKKMDLPSYSSADKI